MTSTEFRAAAERIEQLCIVACRSRRSHVPCDSCRTIAERLRGYAADLDSKDPRTVLGREKQKALRRETDGDAAEVQLAGEI